MKLYRIRDWPKHYEASDNKKVDGPLSWVAVRTKTDGLGYARIASQKNRCELLAAWYLLVGVAAKQNRDERGKIARDGRPLTTTELEMITRFPAEVFERALVFFSDPLQGWLDCEDVPNPSGSIRTNPDEAGQTPATVQYSTVQNTTGQDSTGQTTGGAGAPPDARAAAFEAIWAAYPSHRKVGKKATKAIVMALLAKNPPSFADELIAKTKAYAEAVACWPSDELCFVPHPERWFKNERFNDDPATWASKAKGAISDRFNKF